MKHVALPALGLELASGRSGGASIASGSSDAAPDSLESLGNAPPVTPSSALGWMRSPLSKSTHQPLVHVAPQTPQSRSLEHSRKCDSLSTRGPCAMPQSSSNSNAPGASRLRRAFRRRALIMTPPAGLLGVLLELSALAPNCPRW